MSDDTFNTTKNSAQSCPTSGEYCEAYDESSETEPGEPIGDEGNSQVIEDLNQSFEDYIENYQDSWQEAWQESIATFELDVIKWQSSIKMFELDVIAWQDHVATFQAIEQEAIEHVQNKVPTVKTVPIQNKAQSVAIKKVKSKSKSPRT